MREARAEKEKGPGMGGRRGDKKKENEGQRGSRQGSSSRVVTRKSLMGMRMGMRWNEGLEKKKDGKLQNGNALYGNFASLDMEFC